MSELIKAAQRAWPAEILVEPARLEMPIWGRSEGDICAAYCADKFPKVKTFLHDGQLFTNCGGLAEESMQCYPLIPETDYQGPEPRQYSYEGRAVTYKGRSFKLGPQVKFTVRPRTLEEWTDLLRRQYAHGGYFASGKTYHEVLHYFLESWRTSEEEKKAIHVELTQPNPPLTQKEMLGRLGRPTSGSKKDASVMQLSFAGL